MTKHPSVSFGGPSVLITVPASFDAVARDLTLKAAADAGYPQVTLLEETASGVLRMDRRASELARAGQGRRT